MLIRIISDDLSRVRPGIILYYDKLLRLEEVLEFRSFRFLVLTITKSVRMLVVIPHTIMDPSPKFHALYLIPIYTITEATMKKTLRVSLEKACPSQQC
jgi:hypothetical protein